MDDDEGSFLLGFVLGFFLGCIGLLVAILVLPGAKTKSGAITGFVSTMVIGMCLGGLSGVLVALTNL